MRPLEDLATHFTGVGLLIGVSDLVVLHLGASCEGPAAGVANV